MAAWFRDRGLEGEIVGEPADARSFVLRLESGRPGPSLLLLAHEDVVPADADDWQVPPFSGLIRDGYVWGRGAVDIKNLVAAHAVADGADRRRRRPRRRHARLRLHRRRGGGLGRRRPLARRAPPRPGEDGLRDQRGRGALPRARRAPRLPARERREGHGAVPPHRQGRGRPRVGAAAQRQRRRGRGARRRRARLARAAAGHRRLVRGARAAARRLARAARAPARPGDGARGARTSSRAATSSSPT